MQLRGRTVQFTLGLVGVIVFVSVVLTSWDISTLWGSGERARVELLVDRRQDAYTSNGYGDDEDDSSTSDYPWEGDNTGDTVGGFGKDLWTELFGDVWPSKSSEDPGTHASPGDQISEQTGEWPEPTPGNNWGEGSNSQVAGDEWSTLTYSDVSLENEPTTTASSDDWSWWDSESDTNDDDDQATTIAEQQTTVTKPTRGTSSPPPVPESSTPPVPESSTPTESSPPPVPESSHGPTEAAWDAAESSTIAQEDRTVPCARNPVIADFCILPEGLRVVLGGANATMATVYSRVFDGYAVTELTEECSPYEWCLDSNMNVFPELVSNIRFWTSDEYDGFCWPGLSTCLRVIVDYYDNCDNYDELDFMVRSLELLCSMRDDSARSAPCIEQTLKLLHVSMVTHQRNGNERYEKRSEPECESPEALMSKQLICTTYACVNHTYFLYDFLPWSWFSRFTGQLQRDCDLVTDPPEDRSETSTVEYRFDTSTVATAANVSDENQLQLDAADADQDADHQDMDIDGISAEPRASKLVLALSLICAITMFMLAIMGFVFWRRVVRNRSKPGTGKCFKDGLQYFEIESPIEDEDD